MTSRHVIWFRSTTVVVLSVSTYSRPNPQAISNEICTVDFVMRSVCWTSLTNRRTVWTLRATVCLTVCATVAWCERYDRLLDKLSVPVARSIHTVQLLYRQFLQQFANCRIVWTKYKAYTPKDKLCREICQFASNDVKGVSEHRSRKKWSPESSRLWGGRGLPKNLSFSYRKGIWPTVWWFWSDWSFASLKVEIWITVTSGISINVQNSLTNWLV